LTTDNASDAALGARIDLLKARAAAGDCDLVVRGRREVRSRGRGRELDVGYLYQPATGLYRMNIAGAAPVIESQLRTGSERDRGADAITYTAVPPGSGVRMALDRDLDGAYDGDEVLAGKDPADPASH
jgi:hypothetical protein